MNQLRTDEEIISEFRQLTITPRHQGNAVEFAELDDWLRTTLAAVREEERHSIMRKIDDLIQRVEARKTTRPKVGSASFHHGLNLQKMILNKLKNALTPNQDGV